MKCDFCKSDKLKFLFIPFGTKRKSKVYLCQKCNLVQSFYSKKHNKKIKSASCDADWGNIRHGKALNHKKSIICIEKIENKKNEIIKILDIGSNRGHFLKSVPYLFPNRKLVIGIEPDKSICPKKICDQKTRIIFKKLENSNLKHTKFDFVFCSHTLEHARSAASMINSIRKLIEISGFFYLEVPNLKIINDSYAVEEFFIDKHSFHFEKKSLISFLKFSKFKIHSDYSDNWNLRLLCIPQTEIKKNPKFFSPTDSRKTWQKTYKKLLKYRSNLIRNRRRLPKISAEIKKLSHKYKIVLFGAGRILDSLNKYGNLKPSKSLLCVDNYLSKYLKSNTGFKIFNHTRIKKFKPQIGIILAKSSTNEIYKILKAYNLKRVIKFKDLQHV